LRLRLDSVEVLEDDLPLGDSSQAGSGANRASLSCLRLRRVRMEIMVIDVDGNLLVIV
jgi:hypothetical protein